MKIAIFGGTGFVGRAVSEALLAQGHEVIIFSRTPRSDREAFWDPHQLTGWESALIGVEVVINLVGGSIGDFWWTKNRKKLLVNSRIIPTQLIVKAMQGLAQPPKLLINASATGYYPQMDSVAGEPLTESAAPGDGFLSQLCVQWEAEATRASAFCRVCCLRLGVVVDKRGGIVQKITPLFKVYLGHILGEGKAPFSWVSLTDLVAIFIVVIQNDHLKGPINCVSPERITFEDFYRRVARALHRPCWFRLPSFFVQLLFGEMSELFLKGALVTPKRLLDQGFEFKNAD